MPGGEPAPRTVEGQRHASAAVEPQLAHADAVETEGIGKLDGRHGGLGAVFTAAAAAAAGGSSAAGADE